MNSAQCGGVETAVINCEYEGAGKSVGNSLGTGVGNGVAEGVSVTSEPASNSITSTAPFNLTVGAWNTYNKNPNNLGTIAKDLNRSIDVLGLAEIHSSSQRKNVKNLESTTIGTYSPPTPSKGNKHMASFPIVYNKTKFQLTSSGYKKLVALNGYADRYAVFVRLKHKATGQEFYVINAHLPHSVEAGGKIHGKHKAEYTTAMGNLTSLIKSFQSANIPLFVVGDFNVNDRRDNCSVGIFPCSSFKKLDIQSGFKLTKNAGIASSHGTHSTKDRLIDYAFAAKRNDTKVSRMTIIAAGSSCSSGNCYKGSDHRPVYATATITPGKGK